jgi:hypothetical protein
MPPCCLGPSVLQWEKHWSAYLSEYLFPRTSPSLHLPACLADSASHWPSVSFSSSSAPSQGSRYLPLSEYVSSSCVCLWFSSLKFPPPLESLSLNLPTSGLARCSSWRKECIFSVLSWPGPVPGLSHKRALVGPTGGEMTLERTCNAREKVVLKLRHGN